MQLSPPTACAKNKTSSNPLIPDQFFSNIFLVRYLEGVEKYPRVLLKKFSVQYKKKFYMTSGRPTPYLRNVKSPISTPPPKGSKNFSIKTVLSRELDKGPIYVRRRFQYHISCVSRFFILNHIWTQFLYVSNANQCNLTHC